MSRPRVIFIFLALYCMTAFGWWGYAHYRSSKELYRHQRYELELRCYKATTETRDEISFNDLRTREEVDRFFYFNYPKLEIVYLDSLGGIDMYLIRPSEKAYKAIESELTRKKWMYTGEGVVMLALLIWGILWVFRTFEQSIKLNKQQNNFLLSITHELKTPLASIKLYLETLLKRDLDKEQRETILINSLHDTDRLRDLVENLLISARLETKKFELVKKDINLSSLVNECIEKFALPRNLEERIEKNIEHEVYLKCDEWAIDTILTNLLSNAAKYSKGTILVLLRSEKDRILLSVADEGEGIPDEEKGKLYEKFYRTGDEQTRRSKGTGLGLFIVKNLLNLHNADINIKDNSPKGTNFEVVFYV